MTQAEDYAALCDASDDRNAKLQPHMTGGEHTMPQLKLDGTWSENRAWYYHPMNGWIDAEGKPHAFLLMLDTLNVELFDTAARLREVESQVDDLNAIACREIVLRLEAETRATAAEQELERVRQELRDTRSVVDNPPTGQALCGSERG